MKKIILLFIVILVQACTPKGKNLISHGDITPGGYVTADGCVQIEPPDGWYWSRATIPDYEEGVASKIVRPHELGYLSSGSQNSAIIVESTMLTWGGNPIIPIDITWDKNPDRVTAVCEKMMELERGDGFVDYQYGCLLPPMGSICDPSDPCLMSWRTMTSTRTGAVIYEKKYMVGKAPTSSQMDDKGAHGWYITHSFVGTKKEEQLGYRAIDSIGKNMRLICE